MVFSKARVNRAWSEYECPWLCVCLAGAKELSQIGQSQRLAAQRTTPAERCRKSAASRRRVR